MSAARAGHYDAATVETFFNPKVVAEWTFPGPGAGRSTHFHLLKATK